VKKMVGSTSRDFEAETDVEVSGHLSGVTVASDTALLLEGRVDGGLTVHQGGMLMVSGDMDATVDRNEGTIGVSGVLRTPLEAIPGDVIVSAGSTVTVHGREMIPGPTGEWLTDADGPLTASERHALLKWQGDIERFVPYVEVPADRADHSWLLWL